MSTRARFVLAIGLLLLTAACGKKGNPLAPLRPLPGRIADLTAERDDAEIRLDFTIPAANADGTTPAVVDRIDIYAVDTQAPPPTAPVPAAGTPAASPVPAPADGTRSTAPAAPLPTEGTPPAAPTAPASAEGISQAAPTVSLPVEGTPAVAPGASGQKAGAKRTAPIAPIPTPAQIIANPKNLRGTISIRHPDPDATSPSDQKDSSKNGKTANGKKDQQPKASRPPAPDDHRPVPGDHAFIIDHLAPSAAGDRTIRRYVAVAVAGKGKGRPGAMSPIVSMPLTESVAAPESVAVTYNETTITVTWVPGDEKTFRVFGTGPVFDNAKAQLLTPAPLTSPTFAVPVKFGEERCFVVRAVHVTGPATTEGAPSTVECVTPADTYPPAAPAGLQAIQEGSAVTLIWSSVDAPDLAGYILLRSDGNGETFRPLMQQPASDTTYKDADVAVGMTYLYAVIAIDKSGNPSEQSNRQSVTIR